MMRRTDTHSIKCENCEKIFVLPNLATHKKRRFCSPSCATVWINKNCKKKKREIRECNQCGKGFEFRLCYVKKGGGKFCSQQCYHNFRRGRKRPDHSKLMKRLYPQVLSQGKLKRKPNGLETKLIQIIERNQLPLRYVGNHALWIGRLNPDFVATNDKKLIVELFGRYWHEKKENLVKLDFEEERSAYFKSLGWDCLVLWDDELKIMTDEEVAEKICAHL